MLTLNKILIKLQQAELFFPALVFNFNLLKISFLLQPDMNEDVGFFLRYSYPHSHTHTHIYTLPQCSYTLGKPQKKAQAEIMPLKRQPKKKAKICSKNFLALSACDVAGENRIFLSEGKL